MTQTSMTQTSMTRTSTTQPLILVATPCFGGMVSQNYMLSVIRLMSYAKSAEFDVSLTVLGSDALISRARSTLVATFLGNPAATHLLFIDADISFEPQQVERMLRFDKDFTGAIYPLKSMDWDQVPQRCVERGENLRQAALSYVGTFMPEAERKAGGGLRDRTLCRRWFSTDPPGRVGANDCGLSGNPVQQGARPSHIRLAARCGAEFKSLCAFRLHHRPGERRLSE
jgi:hypothetical protein